MIMKSVICLVVALSVVNAQTDKTKEEKASGTRVVEAVVDLIRGSCIFPDDKLLLRRIAYVESKDGEDTNTFADKNGQPYYGGIWQVDEIGFKDTQNTVSHPSLSTKFQEIKTKFKIDWTQVTWRDLLKPLYSGLAARLKLSNIAASIPRDVSSQASYWKTYYNTASGSGTTSKFISDVSSLSSGGCDLPKADLVFVLDSSGSVGSSNFATMVTFVENIVQSVDVGKDKIHVGVINYASSANTEFDLDDYTTKANTVSAVNRIFYSGGGTNTAAALDLLVDVMRQTGRGNITGTPQIAIVITDGRSNNQIATKLAAERVHATGMTVFAVGVTSGIDKDELETIGSDPTCTHVFELDGFSEVTSFKEEIEKQACKASAEVKDLEVEIDGELKTGQFQYFTFPMDLELGATFQLTVSDGGVVLYLSLTIRNPSSAHYDHIVNCDNSKTLCDIFVPSKQLRRKRATDNSTLALYSAIEGSGVGQTNKFKLKSFVGDKTAGAAFVHAFSVCQLLAAAVAAVLLALF